MCSARSIAVQTIKTCVGMVRDPSGRINAELGTCEGWETIKQNKPIGLKPSGGVPMIDYIPTVVQVVPYEDYTVDVYFDDGKIVCCHAKKDLSAGVFERIKEYHIFLEKCMVLNGTLAWDIAGDRNINECIDIDPIYLHELQKSKEKIA